MGSSGIDLGDDFGAFARLSHISTQSPTGTTTFNVYGPDDATCSDTPAFTETQPTDISGEQDSSTFTPTMAGIYRVVTTYSGDAFYDAATSACGAEYASLRVDKAVATLSTASYSGDDYYDAVAGACNDPGETVRVYKFWVPFSAHVSDGEITLGDDVHDIATFDDRTATRALDAATGTVTFTYYAPRDLTCSTPIFTSVEPAAATVASDPFTPQTTGTYRVVASYSGDDRHNPAGTWCGDPDQMFTVLVAGATPADPASPGSGHGGSAVTPSEDAALPDTGAGAHLGLLGALGLAMTCAGGLLIASDRRRRT